jgi:acyl-CoA synthetase (AMP-forming)/AMP-acid ligase II/alkylation response protein AidB-like acyl-CoA dehydrogenase/acyl carrier protein
LESPATIVSMLRAAAAAIPDQRAYTFLASAGGSATPLTYGELDGQARAVAAQLRRAGNDSGTEACVLVVFPPGLDFLAGFFGCLYAGAIAIPTRYPNHSLSHLGNIARDSGATIGLTTPDLQPLLARELSGVSWLTIADIDPALAAEWEDPGASADDIAYLQYTSGSTATPKGVVVCHSHVVNNCRYFSRQLAFGTDSRILTWLPHFHDLGLIFGLIAPLYNRCPAFAMSPMAFAQRPLNWLQAMSDHRVTHCAAPNFAYQACLAIPTHQLDGLDLSAWRCALNGAETVRADTIDSFGRRFAPYGFRADAFCPGYGLAEATLVATTCGPGLMPNHRDVNADGLPDGLFVRAAAGERSTRLIGSGRPDAEMDVVIANPDTGARCVPGRIGEIWLAGPSITAGYWNNPEATQKKFAAHLACGAGPFLRTGDLGAIDDGELFVLGRMDDLIIIRGANYTPEDLEMTVEGADPALTPGGGAVVAVDLKGEPRLVVFHEVERQALRKLDADRVVKSIVRIVSERHQLEVSAVVLLKPRGLPRTHSGKKQRHACRHGFLDAGSEGVHTWVTPALREALVSARTNAVAPAAPAAQPIIVEQLNERNSKVTTMHAPTNAARAAAPMNEPADAQAKVTDLNAWLRAYASERLNSHLMDERRSIPPYVVLDLGNRGVLGMQAPERYGGLGLDNRSFARVLEQLAALDLTLGSFVTVNNCLGVRPILLHATPEKRDELLPILAPGRELASFAMTEPGAGSNVRGIVSQGRPDGADGWRLFGTKVWSGSAAWAGVINTFVRIDEGAPGGPRGVTGFVVRQGSPGLRMGPEALTMGLRAMVQNEVRLEGVQVKEADLLGAVGDGMTAAMDTMEFGRFSIAALSVGVIKRCLQLMLRHAGRRTIATGKLLANPVTLMRISDLTAAAAAVEALVGVVAERLDRGLPVPAEIYCACKTSGPEFAWRAADTLMQSLAGRGYIETNIAPQILRDTRILRIFEGPSEPMNMHIGSRLVHSAEELRRLLADDLQQPTLAAEIEVAAARIFERCTGAGSRLSDPMAAKQWAYSQAGEVGTYGILLAAIKHQARLKPSGSLRRAEEWARLRFDRRLAKALATSAAEAVLLASADAEALVAGYAESIGDVEQSMPDELRIRDVLIERDVAPPAASVAEPREDARATVAAAAVNGAAMDDGKAREIGEWLARWLSEAFQRPAADIQPSDVFSEFGMDSVRAVMLINALEDWLGLELPPTLIWDYPSLGQMAGHLAALAAARAKPPQNGAVKNGADAAKKTNGHAADDDMALLAQVDRLSQDEIKSLLAQFPESD